jgi:MFS family permease
MLDKKKYYTALVLLAISFVTIYYVPYLYYYFGNEMEIYFDVPQATIAGFVGIYGLVAFFLYIPAGIVADMFGAKRLLVFSLVATGILSALYAMTTSAEVVKWITVGMAVTTILTFWSAWLKSIARVGGQENYAKSYGTVYAMTGVFTVAFGTICVALVNGNAQNLPRVLWFYTVIYLVTALLVFFIFPSDSEGEKITTKEEDKFKFSNLVDVIKTPAVWYIGFAIMAWYMFQGTLAAYNKMLPFYFDTSEVMNNFVATWRTSGVIIFAGPAAVWLQSRFKPTAKTMQILAVAAIALITTLFFVSKGTAPAVMGVILVLAVAFISLGCRSIYYATMGDVKIKPMVVGTATGFISLIAYLSDTFIHTWVANLINNDAGEVYAEGFNKLFLLQYGILAMAIAFTGLIYFEAKRLNKKA